MKRESKELKTAVILSSHTIGLSVIRALGMMGIPIIVFYYEKKDMGYTSKYVKERIYSPHPEKEEHAFINLLITYGKKLKGSILFPADDATVTAVSKNKSTLNDYYIIACPDWNIAKKYIDKKYTYALAEEIGVPAPKSIVASNFKDVTEYADDADYPCIVKPCRSHIYFDKFKKKMTKVYNKDDLIAAYLEAEKCDIEILLQEYIPGDDSQGVNYNSFSWEDKPIIEFTASKCRLGPPDFGVPRVVKSSYIPDVLDQGRKILQALEFNGYSCIEFKKDIRDGLYKLMEVNGRHNRSGLLSLKCGINYPFIEFRALANGYISKECHFIRDVYWIDEFLDVFNTLKYYRKEKLSLREFTKPYFKPHIFAVFDIKDPKPFIKRIADMLKMSFQRSA